MSKSDLVLNGILPVDQLRDWISPVDLLAKRIPRDIIERYYGIVLPIPGIDENPERSITGSEILSTFAISRGFMTSNFGNPDQARSSRIILKDYISVSTIFLTRFYLYIGLFAILSFSESFKSRQLFRGNKPQATRNFACAQS
jgi:hypothetical protein